MPYISVEYLMKIEDDLPLDKDTVFVISYPKSGQCATNNHEVLENSLIAGLKQAQRLMADIVGFASSL